MHSDAHRTGGGVMPGGNQQPDDASDQRFVESLAIDARFKKPVTGSTDGS
jgi:hypothetical protein